MVIYLLNIFPCVSTILQLAAPLLEPSHWALLHSPHLNMMLLCLLGFHIRNLGRFFDIFRACICIFYHRFYVGPYFLQLLGKVFLCDFPPFLRLHIKILHFALSSHEGIILQDLVIIFQSFLHIDWIQTFLPLICTFY